MFKGNKLHNITAVTNMIEGLKKNSFQFTL